MQTIRQLSSASSIKRSLAVLASRLIRAVVIVSLASPAFPREHGSVEAPLTLTKTLFTEADSCRAEVRVFTPSRRAEVRAKLPVGIHNNEAGTRVIYACSAGATPLGLIHVRQEVGEWGLITIAWQLDLDLSVRDFKFLQCREPGRAAIESDVFRELLRGRGSEGLQEILEGSEPLLSTSAHISKEALSLARTIVASGIKATTVTQVGWSLAVSKLRIRKAARHSFAGAASIQFEVNSVPASVLEVLEESGFGRLAPIHRNSLLLAHAHDSENDRIGSMVHMVVETEDGPKPALFAVVGNRLRFAEASVVGQSRVFDVQLARLAGMSERELAAEGSNLAQAASIALCVAQNCGDSHGD